MAILELGAGKRPTEGCTHYHDRLKHSDHITDVWDLNVVPWPWGDEQFDKLVALDVLEHLSVPVPIWLDECWRILRPGGELRLRLPAWDNPVSYRDPTHVRPAWHAESFDYWDPAKALWQDYGSIYFAESARWWHVLGVGRVNPDPRYHVGDLGFVLKKRTAEVPA